MPEISQKARLLPASPIRKLVPFADQAKKNGTHVYHLNIGQPDIDTPDVFLEAIVKEDLRVLAYTHSAGIEPLRKQIRAYYSRLGHELDMEQILVTTGASEALSFVMAACTDPGDEIIIPEPFYANYNSFALQTHAKLVPITTRIEDHFALPDMEAFEALITPKTRAIMICNPGNPTGILYPRKALEKLREIVLKHDLFLIADEVYREFVYGDEPHHSVLGLSGLDAHVVVTDSISKRFSACGARIGCIISRNEALMQSVLKMAQARLSPPTLGQIGAAALYGLPASYYEGVKAEYEHRKNVLIRELNQLEGVFCPPVNGAFYAMVRLPVADTDHFCRWMLESFSYQGATVMCAPGSGFYASPGLGQDEVRIAYVLQAAELKKAVTCLGEGLKAYPGAIAQQSSLASAG